MVYRNPANIAPLSKGIIIAADSSSFATQTLPAGIDGSFLFYDSSVSLKVHWSSGPFSAYTPVVQGSSTVGTATYSTQLGQYILLGNLCIASALLVWTDSTSTGSQQVTLPFNISSALSNVVVAEILFTAAYTSGSNIIGAGNAGEGFVTLQTYGSGVGLVNQGTVTAGTVEMLCIYTI